MKKRGATEARARVSVVVRAVQPHSSRLQPPAVTMGPSAGATGSCGGQGLREVFSLQLPTHGSQCGQTALHLQRDNVPKSLSGVLPNLAMWPFLSHLLLSREW